MLPDPHARLKTALTAWLVPLGLLGLGLHGLMTGVARFPGMDRNSPSLFQVTGSSASLISLTWICLAVTINFYGHWYHTHGDRPWIVLSGRLFGFLALAGMLYGAGAVITGLLTGSASG